MTSVESACDAVPNDIFLIVFSLLDVVDLLRCIQVCRRFRGLIETDASLRYRIELVASGMVDGPPGGTGTADRLKNLREHNAGLRSGKYVCVEDRRIDPDEAPWERVWSTGGSIAYVVPKPERDELVLLTPPAIGSSGTGKRTIVVSLDQPSRSVLVATDYTQGLLVGVSRRIADCSDFQIQIGALEPGRLEHPRAHAAVLRTSAFDRYVEHGPAFVNALRIYSQYVFLVVYVDAMGPYEFQAWNWTTGVLVWRAIVTMMGSPRFTLIDDVHVAIIGSRESRIVVYCFSPHPDHEVSPYASCGLSLPGASKPWPTFLNKVFFFVHDISISLPTSAHHSESPGMFSMDADSAVLAIDFTTSTGFDSDRYVLVVPTSSLRAAVSAGHSRSSSYVALDWPDWGSSGLLLHECEPEPTPSRIYPVAHGRPYGSRVPVLLFGEADSTVGHIIIVETHPWASKYAGKRTCVENSEREKEAGAATPSLDEHIHPHLHGHPMNLTHAIYRGPVISVPQGVEPDELVLDENGVTVVYAPPGDHGNDRVCCVQTWALA